MTIREAPELDKAIERAEKNGIEVVAHGFAKKNNARIWCTNSHSDPDKWHVVMLVGRRLVCDCNSAVICAHRGAVHVELVIEAAKKQAEAVEAALQEEARVRDSAVLYPGISIFK